MSLPSADATLTLTVPASTPMSPVPGSPLAKMVVPRAAFRVFMYEPRCSITAGGRSRNSEWLRSRDNLSRGRSAGRLPPGIDIRPPFPSQTHTKLGRAAGTWTTCRACVLPAASRLEIDSARKFVADGLANLHVGLADQVVGGCEPTVRLPSCSKNCRAMSAIGGKLEMFCSL